MSKPMTPTEQDKELREKLKGAVLETGRYETIGDEKLEDKYLRRFIDELVLHAKAYTDERVREARVDEQERTGSFKYDDGDVEIRVYHPTGQYMQQDIRIAELKAQQEKSDE